MATRQEIDDYKLIRPRYGEIVVRGVTDPAITGFTPKLGVIVTPPVARGEQHKVTFQLHTCPCATCNHDLEHDCEPNPLKRPPSEQTRGGLGCPCCSELCV